MKFEEILENNKGTFRVITWIGIFLLIVIGYTNFNVVTDEKIVVRRMFYTKEYKYEDISNITTGITDGKDINLYYNLKMNNGSKIKLISGIMDTEEAYENVIYNIDKKLVSIGASKEIDTSNIDKFLKQNYNDEYEANVLRILNY